MTRALVRMVRGLREAEFVPQPPFPLLKARGTAARRGIAYEGKVIRKLRREFPNVVHGPWIRYEDDQGEGYCQPDGVVVTPEAAIVVEVKYTETHEGRDKLKYLYGPLVERIMGRPTKKLLVFRNAVHRPDPLRKVRDPKVLVWPTDPEVVFTWHYVA